MTTAAARWAEQLAAWAIPDHILAAAPESPWQFARSTFAVVDDDDGPDTPSRARAREAIPPGGTVLDVGCGGGRASLPLAPPAGLLIGFDQSADLLASFAESADRRGAAHREIQGSWPADAGQAPVADVVVSHHVVYNVADLGGFAAALSTHARRRVVVEMTSSHPRRGFNWLWPHFWGIERPTGPTADDAMAVLAEVGIEPQVVRAPRPPRPHSHEAQVAGARRYLCLPEEREPEVAALLANPPETPPNEAVTLWWDGTAPDGA